jgi:hypothetical protein
MAVAALVISIVAVLVAGASAFYARQSVAVDAGSLEIERSRRLQERRPRLSGIIKFDLTTGKYMLGVTLHSDEPLAGLEVRIPAGQGVAFRQDPNSGVVPAEPGEVALRASAPSRIAPRHEETWPVDLQKTDLPPVRLEATCHGEHGERWESVLIWAEKQSVTRTREP